MVDGTPIADRPPSIGNVVAGSRRVLPVGGEMSDEAAQFERDETSNEVGEFEARDETGAEAQGQEASEVSFSI